MAELAPSPPRTARRWLIRHRRRQRRERSDQHDRRHPRRRPGLERNGWRSRGGQLDPSPNPAESTLLICRSRIDGLQPAHVGLGYAGGGRGVQHERRLRGANVLFVGNQSTAARECSRKRADPSAHFDHGSANQAIGIFVGGGTRARAAASKPGNGTYNLQGGLIVGGGETVGCYGTGTFNQSGGTNCLRRQWGQANCNSDRL